MWLTYNSFLPAKLVSLPMVMAFMWADAFWLKTIYPVIDLYIPRRFSVSLFCMYLFNVLFRDDAFLCSPIRFSALLAVNIISYVKYWGFGLFQGKYLWNYLSACSKDLVAKQERAMQRVLSGMGHGHNDILGIIQVTILLAFISKTSMLKKSCC